MQIYFAGSIRGGRKDAGLYRQFISYLQQFGTVCTEHVGDPLLTSAGDDGPTDRFIHDRDMAWLEKADVVVAEVSTVSMGVGYEIGRAVEAGKKVICLYRSYPGQHLSAMIAGCPDLIKVHYTTPEEAYPALKVFLKSGL